MQKQNLNPFIIGILAIGSSLVSAIPAAASNPNDYLFVGDYYTGNLLKYDASGTPIGNQPFIANPNPGTNNGIKEGVHGTANTLVTVTGTTISRFTDNGTFINNVATGFSGIGNMAITPDANFVYVADESGSKLYKVSMATGAKVATVSLGSVHDVVISGNYIYASSYSQNAGVYRYDLNLGGKTQIIAPSDNGLTRASGLAVDPHDGSLWIVQNSPYANINVGSGSPQPNSGGIWHYTYNSGTGTWGFDKKTTSSLIQFGFGSDFGPDGRLYVATLGDFHVRNTGQYGSDPDYHNGIYAYDPTTNAISPFIITGTYDGHDDAPGPDGISGPKYIKWSDNFVPANDSGYVPEPSGLATGALGILMLGTFLFRARRRTNE